MFIILFPILALCGACITPLFTPISWWWAPLLWLGYFLGLYLLFFLIGMLLAPFFSKKKPVKHPSRFARFLLVEAYALGLAFMGARCRVEGLEKLPPRGTTFLIVSNHLSNYDHMLMMVKLRRYPIAFISKPENFTIPFVGRYLWHSGFLSIDRGSARNAIRTVNETADRIKNGVMCYGVFPEGTRSRKGILLPFHSGVFLSATKAKSPILVIHMQNTEQINRRGPFRPTRVKMDILAYLPAEYTTTHTDAQISEETRAMMLEKYPNP